MMKFYRIFMTAAVATVGIALFSCGGGEKNYTQYVDPYIGTGGHGHVFLGASVPHGFVQLGPTQITQGWDWTSGYNYADSTIVGFGHHHLSGTGIGDLGDISFMPAVGNVAMASGRPGDYEAGFFSEFSHDRESVRPGYYSVRLDRYDIDAELTATERVGFHKYTYPAAVDAKIIIDLVRGIGWDAPVESYITQESPTTISGYRLSRGWARDQRVYFTAEFSKPMADFRVYDAGELCDGETLTAKKVYGEALFATEPGEEIFVKVALSPVSIENAKENMAAELPGWDFDGTVRAADEAWNRELAKIDFRTADEEAMKVFYTAMYHYAIAPTVFHDVSGQYRGSDGENYTADDYTNYTLFSLWDTYRATHPLMTIIDPELSRNVGRTFLNIFEQQGYLPVWHLMGNETNCMVGNPGVAVLADLVQKGYVDDRRAALDAMIASAFHSARGLQWFGQYGYIPYDITDPEYPESVSKGLEYAIADWSIAETALLLGDESNERYFRNRSKAYRHYYDPMSGFMRARALDGTFKEPFDPLRSAHEGLSEYTEGNGWQYTFLVPHDVYGLINIMGGEDKFLSKIDSLFALTAELGPEAPPDVTGLIGQYAHGNEPSHHVAYMYSYIGRQWQAAEKVREIMATMYDTTPEGLCGNEDVGQMSAWYVMSAMGFYQMAPSGGVYVFGSPLMDKAVVKLPEGRELTIVAHHNSPENIYIQSVKLNGKVYEKSYITHDDVMRGGKLEFTMGPKPSQFGFAPQNRPL